MKEAEFIQKLYEFIDSDKSLSMGRNGNGHSAMKYDFINVFHNWLHTGHNDWDEFNRVDNMVSLVEPTILDHNHLDNYVFDYIKDIIPTFEKLKQGKYFFPYDDLLQRHSIDENDVTKFLVIVEKYIKLNPKGKRGNGRVIKIIRSNQH